MQGGKKPTRATARKAGLLEELLAQPNTYQKSQPPSWLCTTTAGYCWESRAQKISPSGSTCFQTELGKIQMGSASCERNSSICTSFKGTARDRAGLRSAALSATVPKSPREGVTSTPRALTAPFPTKFLETKDFQQEQPS